MSTPRKSGGRRAGRWPSNLRLRRVAFEQLETRSLLSAMPLSDIMAHPLFTGPFQPSQITQTYNFKSLTFANGSVAANGSGQTIAIVDAYNDPNISSDLATFDAQWGLAPPPSFTKVVQVVGGRSPATSSGWAMEIALDVEWAHAMAPGANILLVEANTSSLSNLLSAVKYAANYPGVSVVSMSWGSTEFSSETSFDSTFTTPSGHAGVTFVAASGDSGAPGLWPAFSPNVLAVGGTSLTTDTSGNYVSETGWSGSGGGQSLYEAEPSYQSQSGFQNQPGVQSTGRRQTPDVAYNANPSTGYYVYESVPYYGQKGWWEVGGTSAAAPQWAALVAIANQGRALAGEGALQNATADLYSIYYASKYSSSPVAFHDITSGNNGAYQAGSGYDLVTGLGTPMANQIINDLVAMTSNGTQSAVLAGATHLTSTRLARAANGGGTQNGIDRLEAAFLATMTQSTAPSLNFARAATLTTNNMVATADSAAVDARAAWADSVAANTTGSVARQSMPLFSTSSVGDASGGVMPGDTSGSADLDAMPAADASGAVAAPGVLSSAERGAPSVAIVTPATTGAAADDADASDSDAAALRPQLRRRAVDVSLTDPAFTGPMGNGDTVQAPITAEEAEPAPRTAAWQAAVALVFATLGRNAPPTGGVTVQRRFWR